MRRSTIRSYSLSPISTVSSAATRGRLLVIGQGALVFSALAAPRAIAVLAFLPPLVMLALTHRRSWLNGIALNSWPIRASIAFGLFSLVSVAWSASPAEGLGKVLIFFGLLATCVVVARLLAAEYDSIIAGLARATLAAMALGLFLLAFEEVTDHTLRHVLYSVFPALRPPAKHLIIVNGELEALRPYLTNRNMAVLTLLLWPALGMAAAVLTHRRLFLAIAAVLGLALIAISNSQHETSLLALVLGTFVFAVALIAPRLARGLLIAGWCAATLLIVPIAKELYARGLHLSSSIPYSGKQRIVLWAYTAEEVAKRPLYGVGIAATKALDERNVTAVKPAGYPYPRRTGPHAHNVYLQTWYELGAVGAALLLAFGLAMITAIGTLAQRIQPYAAATFASAATMGAFTWSLWQAWFMGLFALVIMLILLGAEFTRRAEQGAKL